MSFVDQLLVVDAFDLYLDCEPEALRALRLADMDLRMHGHVFDRL